MCDIVGTMSYTCCDSCDITTDMTRTTYQKLYSRVMWRFITYTMTYSYLCRDSSSIFDSAIFRMAIYCIQNCQLYSIQNCKFTLFTIANHIANYTTILTTSHSHIYLKRLIQPIPNGVSFSKAQSSNVSFATFLWKETLELWALSFETAFVNVTPSGIGCTYLVTIFKMAMHYVQICQFYFHFIQKFAHSHICEKTDTYLVTIFRMAIHYIQICQFYCHFIQNCQLYRECVWVLPHTCEWAFQV